MSGYSFHPEAERDLNDIWDFIAHDNHLAADRVVSEILAVIDKAVSMPHIGHRRTDLSSKPVRFLHVRDYVVAYLPDRKPLPVLAIMHGRRNPRVLAAILRSRT